MWETIKSYLDASLSRGEAVVLIVIFIVYWRKIVAALGAHKEECQEMIEEAMMDAEDLPNAPIGDWESDEHNDDV